jgi:NSS family neurotransmitter:Na+ symporter
MNNNSRFFSVLLAAAAAIGIGNILAYPYISYKTTGLFFIPYLAALMIIGVPLLMLELTIGQYFNKNAVDLFASIRKRFGSIGWLMVFNAFILMSFYAVILSWHIIYIFASLGLQWKNDAKSYFFSNVLQASEGFSGFTQFSLPVFIALIFAWLLIFIYIRKGYESMKKYVLAAFPTFIILLILFLMYTLKLDNALEGIYSFLRPDLSGLLDIGTWVNSFFLAIASLGLSFGVMHAIGRKGKGFVSGISLNVAVFQLTIGIAIGLILFGTLGFLSMKQGIGIDKLIGVGFDFPFTVLAQALPLFYKPTLMSILFFIFLSIFFIFGAASLAYAITHVLVHKFRTKHANAAIIVAGFGFLFGLLLIIKPGFYIMDIMSHFIFYNICIALLLEAVAVGWFSDSERLSAFINQSSIIKIGKLWRFLIRYVIPLVIVVVAFIRLKSDFLFYSKYPLPYVLIFGVGIVVIPLIVALMMPQKILDRK